MIEVLARHRIRRPKDVEAGYPEFLWRRVEMFDIRRGNGDLWVLIRFDD